MDYLKGKKKTFFLILVFIILFSFIWNLVKPLPEGISFESSNVPIEVSNVDFMYDLTYMENEKIQSDQEIFDSILSRIENANEYILVDMFLFNSWLGKVESAYRPLSGELSSALINKKNENPKIKIDLITDPINIAYGGSENEQIDAMEKAGINVIITDLKSLRDSNPVYSSVWRTLFKWFGNSEEKGWLKHPFSTEEKVGIRTYLSLFNFKANHRKVFLADVGDSYVSIVSSANPHDSSSKHSNVAIEIMSNDFAKDLWESENAVAKMSGAKLTEFSVKDEKLSESKDVPLVRLVTEKNIKNALLEMIGDLGEGEELNMAMFYLSDRNVVKSLKKAAKRGVEINIILDPNKDAFGYEKNGIPNRQVASELIGLEKENLNIRWYATNGEQFHSKLIFVKKNTGKLIFMLGSANLTRRNIDNYNLETNVLVEVSKESKIAKEVISYFETIWNNEQNKIFTEKFSAYEDNSLFKKVIYRIQEFSGLSTF